MFRSHDEDGISILFFPSGRVYIFWTGMRGIVLRKGDECALRSLVFPDRYRPKRRRDQGASI